MLEQLGDASLLIGGLMTKLWLHARPVEVPARATADVDLGIDTRGLGLVGNRKLLQPMLTDLGFENRAADEAFRFAKQVEQGTFVVDLLMASGRSREEPPLLEAGLPSLAAPGLAYALIRGSVTFDIEFVDGAQQTATVLSLPTLDAAFVLKAALVERALRMRSDRRRNDTVDAICLAAACLGEETALSALQTYRRQGEVSDALRWMATEFATERSAAAGRVQAHVEDELGLSTGAEWAVGVAERFNAAKRQP